MTQQSAHPRQEGHGAPALPRLGELLKPYKIQLMLAVLMLIGLTAVNIVIPQLFAIVFDDVFETGHWMLLFTVLGAMLGLSSRLVSVSTVSLSVTKSNTAMWYRPFR